MQKDTEAWSNSLKKLVEKGCSPSSNDAQKIIAKFCKHYQQFCNPTRSQVIALVEAEVGLPECQNRFKSIHPKFAEFYLKAVIYYTEHHLKN